MKTPSPLTVFKNALVEGTRFRVRFEPVVIQGNLGSTSFHGGSGTREVLRTSSRQVVFRTEKGTESAFAFPPAGEMDSPAPDVFAWKPNGKLTLTYERVA